MPSAITRRITAIAATIAIAIAAASHAALAEDSALSLSDFGVFSSGGTVTAPVPGKYNPGKNWQDMTRQGTTAHVDHTSVLYAIPSGSNGIPVVMLHGYGQSRTGFITPPRRQAGLGPAFHAQGLPGVPRRPAAPRRGRQRRLDDLRRA